MLLEQYDGMSHMLVVCYKIRLINKYLSLLYAVAFGSW
jgi:hypothetical protein